METIIIKENPYFKLIETISHEDIRMFEVRSATTERVYYNSFYIALAERFYNDESEAMYSASQDELNGHKIELNSKHKIELNSKYGKNIDNNTDYPKVSIKRMCSCEKPIIVHILHFGDVSHELYDYDLYYCRNCNSSWSEC